jgi:hypothetical protein
MGYYKALEVKMRLQFKATLRVFWATLTEIKKSVHKADFRLAVTIDFILSSPLGLALCRNSKKIRSLRMFRDVIVCRLATSSTGLQCLRIRDSQL